MPSEVENINYLYLVLTNDGNPTIDWDAVSSALDLKKGAVTKRWSRLKQAMEKNEVPGGTAYQFLWLCVKHHTRNQPPNWNEIAAKANTTAGAASKRYSRMKKAFEENDTSPYPSSPAQDTPKSTVKKSRKATTSSGDDIDDNEATPTPKRKRAPPKKKVAAAEEEVKVKSDPENEDEQEDLLEPKPKRAKVGKNNMSITPKPRAKGIVKKEDISTDDLADFCPQGEAGEVDHDSYSVHEPESAASVDSGDDFI